MWWRRRLLFNIPKGREKPYWEIPEEYLVGRVWAPIYHGYGYYMDSRGFQDPETMDQFLKKQSRIALADTTLHHALTYLAWGPRSALKLVGTSVLFAELESYWAVHQEKAVSFGSSHTSAAATGYNLTRWVLAKRKTIWQHIAALYSLLPLSLFVLMWVHDGFGVTGSVRKYHRVDHVAHIGGVVVGALSASLF